MTRAEAIATAALLVSVLVAILQWKQGTRIAAEQSARELEANAIQERIAKVEEGRRLDERAPRIEGRWEYAGGSVSGVRLTNLGPGTIDRLEWSFERDNSAHKIATLEGGTTGTIEEVMLVGDEVVLRGKTHAMGPVTVGRIVLTCLCFVGDEDAVVAVVIDSQGHRAPRSGRVW